MIWAPALYVFLTDEYLGNKGIWQLQLRKSKDDLRSHKVIRDTELEMTILKPFPTMHLAHGSQDEALFFSHKLFCTSLSLNHWIYAGDYVWYWKVSENQT